MLQRQSLPTGPGVGPDLYFWTATTRWTSWIRIGAMKPCRSSSVIGRTASALMERVYALECWLERDPTAHLAQLLEVAVAAASDPAISGSYDEQETNSRELDGGVPDAVIPVPPSIAA